MILDTHVLVWLILGDDRLGGEAKDTIDAASREAAVEVAAITIWEVAMLTHKGRLSLGRDVGAWVQEVLSKPNFKLAPLEPAIAIDSARLPGRFHADHADRIIVATARQAGRPLVTADRLILAYGRSGFVQVIDASR